MTLSLLIVSALLGVPNLEKHTALACSCAELKEPTEALKESTAVFVGRVVEIEESQANQFSYGAIFEVQRAWKGIESDMPVIKVTTGTSGDTCGYGFQENEEYLVYAYGDPKELATGICSRTMTLDSAQLDLTALGPDAVSFDQGSEEEKYKFSIWPVQSEISENWHTDINTRICPNPEVNLIVGPAGSELSTVNITHFAANPEGLATVIRTEHLGGGNDFCDSGVGFGYEPERPGEWTIRANASWTAPDGTIHLVQGNETKLLVKPAIYNVIDTEQLFQYEADQFQVLRLLDWNPEGGAILLSYYTGYQENITSDTEGEYGSQVSLGVLDTSETTINRVDLPVNFAYIFDARYSPSDSNIIFITGSIGDLELQNGLFIYSFEHGTLSRIGPYGDNVVWLPDATGDGQDDFVVGITNSTFEEGEIIANTVEMWITDSNANPIEKLYSETLDSKRGLQIHDITKDGRKILMTSSLHLGGPVTIYNLTIFDIENRRFETMLPFGSGDGARFNPAGDLIVYPVGMGHRTPGGPLIMTTLDGSYVERLSSGERPGTYDSPDTFVISPDGSTIIAGVAQWGSGDIYVTRNELAHPMPEFGPHYSMALAAGLLSIMGFFRHWLRLMQKLNCSPTRTHSEV
jgi:hypothetical protein